VAVSHDITDVLSADASCSAWDGVERSAEGEAVALTIWLWCCCVLCCLFALQCFAAR
jgi:hypothetical protein